MGTASPSPVRACAAALPGRDATLEPIVTVDPESERTEGVRVTPTHREHDVRRLLGCGEDASRIADALSISLHTTRGQIKTLMANLGAHARLGAVVTAEQQGLITVGSRY